MAWCRKGEGEGKGGCFVGVGMCVGKEGKKEGN